MSELASESGGADSSPSTGEAPEGVRTAEDGVLIRSEERLQTGVVNIVAGRARLVTSIVTEEQTFTIPVRRQEIRLVHDPLPGHEQVPSESTPTEETYEVIRYAEQVVFTTEVVPVERVRLVKRVIRAQKTLDEQVRSEQVDIDLASVEPAQTSAGPDTRSG